MRSSPTLEDEHLRASLEQGARGEPEPGLVLIFSGEKPRYGVLPLQKGSIEVGRGEIDGVIIDDQRMSRAHARIGLEDGAWSVLDLESRNGTWADGDEVKGAAPKPARRLLRTGSSLFLLEGDVRPFRAGVAGAGDAVMGPSLQHAFAAIARAAHFGRILHITGESGTGKELSAQAFHSAGPAAAGPFIAVNAATLKAELAEAMLFGARKGFYTNAPGGPGYLQAANGGTLFLDEVAELDLSVQAKLLRALEKREVMPLGATRYEPVDLRFCSATHADLRSMVAAGKMREDLYFRIASPVVELPPLRDRPEEMPLLIERAVKSVEEAAGGDEKIAVHVSFVEACLLRFWPGNVRELIAETKNAAQWALKDGGVLLNRHLGKRAGITTLRSASELPPPPAAAEKPSDEAILAALAANGNNKAEAARALGMHRTQLYRWLEQRNRRSPDSGGQAS